MNRPGNPTELKLMDIAFGAVFGTGHYSHHFGPEKAICPQCGKTVKAVGLKDHVRDVHETKEAK